MTTTLLLLPLPVSVSRHGATSGLVKCHSSSPFYVRIKTVTLVRRLRKRKLLQFSASIVGGEYIKKS
uniref:Secreted protein n=1 Tax=Setaria italica TaxID=4555 RepID=K3ZYU1_SETIT